MRTLIVGGAGFVGGYLAEYLVKQGNEVSLTKMAAEKISVDEVTVYDMNLLNIEDIEAVVLKANPQVIYHLAAQSSVSLSWKNPSLTVDVNIKGTLNLLDTIRKLGLSPRILLIGSGEEYGNVLSSDIPIKEETLLRPANIYAATKACQNMIGKIYVKAYGMDIIMTRSFNHFGPKQAPIFVISDFCKQVAEIEAGLRQPFMSVGNLSAMRDFTDVRDVIIAYDLLIQKGKKGETYNVGKGKAYAISHILEEILKLSKSKIDIKIDEAKLRPSDTPIIEADISKLQKDTGWSPKIPLTQTLEDTLNYERRAII